MDELTLIRDFRAAVPPSDEVAREAARRELLTAIDGTATPFWRRRRTIVATVAFAALALAAAAVASRLVDLFTGKPAPPAVKRELVTMNRLAPHAPPGWPRPGGYRVGATRGIMSLQTPKGTVYLWGIQTEHHNVCTILEGAADGRPHLRPGICVGGTTEVPPILWSFTRVVVAEKRYAGSVGVRGGTEETDTVVLYGHVSPDVTSLELRAPHGHVRHLRLVEGFFLTRLTKRVRSYRLVARKASGKTVDEQPVRMYEPEPDTGTPFIFGHARILVEIDSRSGSPAILALTKRRGGRPCLMPWFANGTSLNCPFHRLDRLGVGVDTTDLPFDQSWLYGDAGRRTRSVEVHFRDGSSVVVPTRIGLLVYELPRHKQLAKLVTRDGHGKVLQRVKWNFPGAPQPPG